MRSAAVVVLMLLGGCAHRELRNQTRQALSDCLHRHPDGQECESLARQNDMLEAQHQERMRTWDDDEPQPKPKQHLRCRPNGLGGMNCD